MCRSPKKKVDKVMLLVQKISREAYGWIYRASLSYEPEKAGRHNLPD